MGLLDGSSKSPEQEKDERATKEGLREAREGGAFSNLLDDISDGLSEGQDYLERKVATREGAEEAARGDSAFNNLINDAHDELLHGRKYVARKQYYRERSGSSPTAEESPNYGGGGGGGGGGSDLGLKGMFFLFLFIIALPAGWFIQRQKRLAYIAELPTVRMNITVGGQDVDESGAVRYARGQPQTLRISLNWAPQAVYWSERSVRVTLSRSGNVQYNHLWKHADLQFNALVFDFTDKFMAGHYLAEAYVEGAPPARHSFVVEPRPPGSIFVSDISPEWPRQEMTTLQHRPGENKKIFAYIRISGTIPAEGRTVYISLVHDGTTLFNYSNHITEQNRDFYIPYEADFSEGLYRARLSADGEPPAEVAFTVQYPVVETHDEKSQQIKQLLDRIMPVGQQPTQADSAITNTVGQDERRVEDTPPPSPAVQSQDCYDGTWRENESNEFAWNFRRYGNTLRIVRNDRFAKGEFRKTPDGWVGFLSWGNGTIWKGVVLHEANDGCNEITTNQRWWYKR
jgi:hypothetical protein